MSLKTMNSNSGQATLFAGIHGRRLTLVGSIAATAIEILQISTH
jgi:hypothetical protein